LHIGNIDVLCSAGVALAHLGNTDGVEPLIGILMDNDCNIRVAAAITLVKIYLILSHDDPARDKILSVRDIITTPRTNVVHIYHDYDEYGILDEYRFDGIGVDFPLVP
jgi:hypothetical protein